MPTIDELIVADEPVTWSALGFDVHGDTCPLAGVTVRLAGRNGGEVGIRGWSLRGLGSTELDGLPTTLSERDPAAPAPVHANGVIGIDHVVAVSPNFERSVETLTAAGMDLRRIRDEPSPAGAPRQAFFRLGSEILELVEEPDEVAERRGGSDRPAHFWGLALLVEEIERTLEHFGEHASPPRPAVQPGRRIATVKRSAGLAFPLALMTRKEDA